MMEDLIINVNNEDNNQDDVPKKKEAADTTEQLESLIPKPREEKGQKEDTKPKTKLKRRYFTRGAWIVAILGSALGLIFANAFYGILITLVLLCFSMMFNIISVYIITGPRYFDTTAYWTVFTSYVLAFTKIILFILDTAQSTTHKPADPTNTSKSALEIIWQVLYWFSMLFNFVWIQFIYVYWTQCHPDMKRKIKATFRYYLFYGAIIGGVALVLLIVLIITLWSYVKELGVVGFFNLVVLIIQIINMAYSWIFYFLLFGYGISAFPYYLFISTDTTKVIHNLIEDMKEARKDFEYSVNKYIKNASYLKVVCENLLRRGGQGSAIEKEVVAYARTIQDSISTYDEIIKFNGVAKYIENIETDFKKEKEKEKEKGYDLIVTYTIDKLADMLMVNQNYIFSFEKKEKMMLKLYYSIRRLCHIGDSKTIFYQNAVTKQEHDSRGNNSEYRLPLKLFSSLRVCGTKLGGVFFIIISSLMYLIQLSIPILYTMGHSLSKIVGFNSDMFYPLIIILAVYCIYVILCSYFALTKFKKLESYTLVTHHTDKYAMLNNAGMLNTIVFGIIYNICLFSYDRTTSISKGFAFFSQTDNNEVLSTIILWVYPAFFTLFGIIFLLKIIGFKLTWLFKSLDSDSDFKSEIAALTDQAANRASIAYSTADLFFKFLEHFEEDYYSVIITV